MNTTTSDNIELKCVLRHARTAVGSYAEILFVPGSLTGLALLAATFFNPNVAIAGLIAVIATYLFARLINMDRSMIGAGYCVYNPLLVGMSIGYLFKITPLTIFMVAAAGVLTLVITVMLANHFTTYFKLPILSLPFAIVSSVTYLASSRYAGLFVTGMYEPWYINFHVNMPIWLEGFFKNMGTILFLPHVIPGIIFSLVILYYSRILFVLAVSGYYTGALVTGLLSGSMQTSFMNISHFNFILIAMALGGVFLIPSVRSYCIALTAVAASIIFLKSTEAFWSFYGIPCFTVPFNFITMSFVYVLGLTNYPLISKYIKKTPEETLDYYLTNARRYTGSMRTIALPFSGRWTVWQGFEGQWTHKGSWKYAYDFVITDQLGNTHKNGGAQLSDYYALNKSVLSPVRGRVVKIINGMDDNPIGVADKANPWGNLIIIYDDRGFYVEISHFAKDSIKVYEGQWVERGALLGLCGNSGNSPQPHIHVQAQATDAIGAATLPFSFVSYADGNMFQANSIPNEGAEVEPLFTEKHLDIRTSPALDDLYRYEVYENERKVDEIGFTVRCAADGTFFYDSGRGKLYFEKHEGTYYAYHVEGDDRRLQAIFTALPRMPLVFKENLRWTDDIPLGASTSGVRKEMLRFASSFYHGLARVKCEMMWEDSNTVTGRVTSNVMGEEMKTRVEFDGYSGFKTIKVDNFELRRIEENGKNHD